MAKIVLLILTLVISQPKVPDWAEVPDPAKHYKLYHSAQSGKHKWLGFPDPNYSWEGAGLSWQRKVKDENGKDVTVKTYKKPFEIIAKLKADSKVFGIAGKIERNAVKRFGGALKGFIWLDNVSGGGEVILPFTAPHIFIATGVRLNPDLAEIGTDPNRDNYYEIVEGKTRVFVKSFSGIGGAAGAPLTLIAHYKMNEDTADDNDELVTNWNFANWTLDQPDNWNPTGEVLGNGYGTGDPEISQVATGESHANAGGEAGGMCNLYTSDATYVIISQTITYVVGRKYRISITVDTVTAQAVFVSEANTQWVSQNLSSAGTHSWVFVATVTSSALTIGRSGVGTIDVTFDDVSIKLCAVEDSSGNDHDGLLQEDTSTAHVAGKINGAFDFDGSADYIEIADHADFTPALTPFSISAWVYMHDASNFYIANKATSSTVGEWVFRVDGNDDLTFFCIDNSASANMGRRYETPLTAYQNQWIHLVAIYDGGIAKSGIKLYLNGVQVDDTDYSSGTFVAIEDLTHAVWIGHYSTLYNDGLIDNVVFFSVALSPDEVRRLFNNRSGTEILQEIDSVIVPRRSNTSPFGLRKRYEF